MAVTYHIAATAKPSEREIKADFLRPATVLAAFGQEAAFHEDGGNIGQAQDGKPCALDPRSLSGMWPRTE